MIAAIPTQPRSKFFRGSRAVLLFLMFGTAFFLLLAASIHYSNATHFTVSDGSTLSMTGAPGERFTITIDAGSSVGGDWATSGVTLRLHAPATFSTQLVAAQDPDWSDTIAIDSSITDSEMLLGGSFTLPSTIDTHTSSITGTITGTMLFPQDNGIFFKDTLKSLNIPVQVTLVSPSEVFLSTRLPLYLTAGLGALILLTLPAFFYLSDRQRRLLSASL